MLTQSIFDIIMLMNSKNYLRKIGIASASVFILTLTFFAGLFVDASRSVPNSPLSVEATSSSVINRENGMPSDVDFSTFWTVWKILDSKHVNIHKDATTTTDSETKVYGAIKGMVDSVNDPYTVFLTPEENKEFNTELSGSLEGVGMEVGIKDGILTVISPIKSSPAERAGVLAGDKIIKIDDTITANLSVSEAVKFIRGKKGTSVVLTLAREGKTEPIVLTLIRDIINVPIIETEKFVNEGVFVIKIHSFSANVSSLFRNALKEFVFSKYSKLVIDVRNNPGGYLDSSVDIVSWFIGPGKTVVTEDFGESKDPLVYRSYGYNIFNENLKLVVLVNEGSASASEIVAGALSEHKIGVLVGEKTFGKGSVQELVPIPGGGALKVTIARWLTPLGNSISEEGLTPQFEVKMTEEDAKAKRDPQMEKALEVLKNL